MKYIHHELSYEIDDAWLREAGALDFRAGRECYRALANPGLQGQVFQVCVGSVAPLIERAQQRGIFCENEKTGESARQRVVRILRRFVSDAEIEPVIVAKANGGVHEYHLLAGCHRFYCANAMGFRNVPAVLEYLHHPAKL